MRIDGRKEKLIALLNSIEGLSPIFKKIEAKDIDYENRYDLISYPEYYRGMSLRNMNFKPSEGYIFPHLSKEELSSDEDLSFSSSYDLLLSSYLHKKILSLLDEKASESKQDYEAAFFTAIEDFPHGEVRSHILVEFASHYIRGDLARNVNEVNEFYNKVIALCADQASKDEITHAYDDFKKLTKGMPSPEFSNYENAQGGVSSLKDFRGKYVYIDMWATWCKGCLEEMPSFEDLQKSYKENDNIAFVSISMNRDREAWLAMVKQKQFKGVQLLADAEWLSQFARDYQINSIPRYIIIDPDGNIVNADAPRPSDPALLEAFKELKL